MNLISKRLQRETRTSAPNTQNDVDVEAAGLTPTADVADSAPVEAPVDAPVETPASSSSTSSPASMTAEQLAELRTSTGVDFIRVEQLGHGETVVINNKVSGQPNLVATASQLLTSINSSFDFHPPCLGHDIPQQDFAVGDG